MGRGERTADPLRSAMRRRALDDALLHELLCRCRDHVRRPQAARRLRLREPTQGGRLAEKRLAAAEVML